MIADLAQPSMKPNKIRTRSGSWRTFERRFQPIDSPDGTVWWTAEQLPQNVDPHLVWTIVEGDKYLWLRPGFRFVNRVDYVLCAVPWTDDDVQQPDYRYD